MRNWHCALCELLCLCLPFDLSKWTSSIAYMLYDFTCATGWECPHDLCLCNMCCKDHVDISDHVWHFRPCQVLKWFLSIQSSERKAGLIFFAENTYSWGLLVACVQCFSTLLLCAGLGAVWLWYEWHCLWMTSVMLGLRLKPTINYTTYKESMCLACLVMAKVVRVSMWSPATLRCVLLALPACCDTFVAHCRHPTDPERHWVWVVPGTPPSCDSFCIGVYVSCSFNVVLYREICNFISLFVVWSASCKDSTWPCEDSSPLIVCLIHNAIILDRQHGF